MGEYTVRPLLKIIQLLRPYWRYIGQSLITGITISFLGLPGPYITKLLLDDVYPHQDFSLLYFVLLAGAVIAIFSGLMQAFSSHFGRRVSIGMSLDFQSRFYRHIQGLDFGFFDGRKTGEILARFNDMQASISQVIGIVNAIVMNGLQLLIFPAVLFWIDWRLALISLAVLPFDTLLAAITRTYYCRFSQRIAEESAELSARAFESLSSIRTVQTLGLESCFFEKLRGVFLQVAGLQVKTSCLQNGAGFISAFFRAGGSLAYSWYGWTQVLNGNLSVGTFMAFSGYVGFLYGPIGNLIGLMPQLEVTLVHTRRFLEIYELEPAVQDHPQAVFLDGIQGRIEFRGVNFSYVDTPVLRDIDLEIPARSCVALVGKSGSGKSTLVKLIPRFYDPCQGYVAIDGKDIRQCQLKSLRQQVGFSLQGSQLFQGSIWENLTFGRDISLRNVEDATRAAHIHEFVTSLPEGYHTEVGEGGSGLSEGQKQRLVLARVLLFDTPILILDEPTSALDMESEFHVREALKVVREGRTTIIIAHRPVTVQDANMVIALDDGRVLAGGKLDKEMAAGSFFKKEKVYESATCS
jgi:ABC-type bacteriocin/lantibiotic exporter with double-glycine peptidase domain